MVYSEHAGALSWLVVELKKVYDCKLNYLNKYDFYPYISELIQASIITNDDLFETMLYEDWGKK